MPMKAPDKIYIPENLSNSDKIRLSSVDEKGRGIPYIRKDALLEWAKNLKDRWCEPPESKHSPGCVYMLEQVIDKLNSL